MSIVKQAKKESVSEISIFLNFFRQGNLHPLSLLLIHVCFIYG